MKAPSISESLAKALYGRSDKVNAAENSNPDFQDGYRTSLANPSEEASDLIHEEFKRRNFRNDDSFCEWKRGMWAATMQRIEASIIQQST